MRKRAHPQTAFGPLEHETRGRLRLRKGAGERGDFRGPATRLQSDASGADSHSASTSDTIQHVIISVGENRSFDHLFATDRPRRGYTVKNLLSEGIIKADGQPGPNYARAAQFSADVSGSSTYEPSPSHKTLYANLPTPLTGGPSDVCADERLHGHHSHNTPVTIPPVQQRSLGDRGFV